LCTVGRRLSNKNKLVLSGGVALNSSLNGLLLRGGAFDDVFALPMSSDRGIGLGAALYHVHQTLGVPRFFVLEDVFFGSDIDDKAAAKAMKKSGLRYARSDDVQGLTAQALAEGKIVGWVQGRSEVGARALGNRSILADPRRVEMKDIINSRVKHREWFRPFAPSILKERATDYFVFPSGVADLSYMTFTVDSTAKAKVEIPATIHVDGSARVQVVDASRHPEYYRLIECFDKITGIPVLLNTSFNDNDEPIVETAEDAVKTFLKTDMDLLCIGNVVGKRP
jgi:carbamoyltransferase